MTQKVRIQLNFQRINGEQLIIIGTGVVKGMTDNKKFSNPPVDIKAVQTAVEEFNSALAATVHGGPAATATKNNKRDVLVDLLQKVGHYVQSHANNDLDAVLSTGFIPLPPRTTTSSVPAKPTISAIVNANTTELVVKVQRISNAKFYFVRSAAVDDKGTPGEWKDNGFFSKSQTMLVSGLKPGTNYVFQVRAMGTIGFSDWSDPVVHVCW